METERKKLQFNESTFLTSLIGGDVSAGKSSPSSSSLFEPKSMTAVRETYKELTTCAGSLSEQIQRVLQQQEQDFLAAYRAHMYSVQQELYELRKTIQMSETSAQKSEKMKKLEAERDWYRKEALRLDEIVLARQDELKLTREQSQVFEEDRNWMEKQLKASKKQNKLLRAELELQYASPQRQERPSPEPPVQPTHPIVTQKQYDALVSKTQLAETQHRRHVKTLKHDLQSTKLELVTSQQSRLSRPKPGKLEEFFVRCVDSVKKDMARRKRDAALAHHVHVCVDDVPPLSDFSHSDRTQVIERLLSHDQVLSVIYDHLFPTKTRTAAGDDEVVAVGSARLAVKSIAHHAHAHQDNNHTDDMTTISLDEDTRRFLAQSSNP